MDRAVFERSEVFVNIEVEGGTLQILEVYRAPLETCH